MPIRILLCDLFFACVVAADGTPNGAKNTEDVSESAQPVVSSADRSHRIPPSVRQRHKQLSKQLKVQVALRDGKRFVREKSFRQAIETLEPVLPQANGSDAFLVTLEDAYKGFIAELIASDRTDEARLLDDRLRILSGHGSEPIESPIDEVVDADPTSEAPASSTSSTTEVAATTEAAALVTDVDSVEPDRPKIEHSADFATPRNPLAKMNSALFGNVLSTLKNALPGGKRKPPSAPASETSKATANSSIPTATKRSGTERPFEFRAQIQERSAAARADAKDARQGTEPLRQADALFVAERYTEALPLYERAYELDPDGVQVARDRWGYCLLFVSTDRFNELIARTDASVTDLQWGDLESDMRLGQRLSRLSPKMKAWADDALKRVAHQRRATKSRPVFRQAAAQGKRNLYGETALESVPARSFRHLPGRSRSWSVIETDNFLIHHRDPALAEEVARLAEEAREYSHEKWFGDEPLGRWTPRCELYLYPTAHEYSRATGVGPQSPGQSKVQNEGGRILSRRIDLRTDETGMKHAVLPHEITHVVLAGRFGARALPRWADEGLAVLTEPRDMAEAHVKNLVNARATGRGYSCAQVMTMTNYPEGAAMRNFYAHSVGVCRYLVEKHGARKMTTFLRAALRSNNYESALMQVYGMRSFTELEQGFQGYLATLSRDAVPGIANRKR